MPSANTPEMFGAIRTVGELGIPPHDWIGLSYTGADLTGVTYRLGGESGPIVATLTLGYSGGNLVSVSKTVS